MKGLKRIGFYLLLNLLVVSMLTIILAFVPMPESQMYTLLIFCVIFGFAGSLISLALSKFIAKKAYKIQLIDADVQNPQARFVYNAVVGTCQRSRSQNSGSGNLSIERRECLCHWSFS